MQKDLFLNKFVARDTISYQTSKKSCITHQMFGAADFC